MAAKEIDMEFAAQMGMTLLGGLFVIWLRAAWSVKAAKDRWEWKVFFADNLPKFVMVLIGNVILCVAAYNDAAGVQSVLDRFGIEIQSAVGFGLGAAVGAFLLVIPSLDKLLPSD